METIYYNGFIYTGFLPLQQAFVEEKGIFKYVGDSATVLAMATEDDVKIDLRGRFVCPGFNDSHMHLLGFGKTLNQAILSEHTESLEAVLNCLKAFEGKPEDSGLWLLGRGWNQDYFTDANRMPNRYDLDRVSTERPISITRACGHCLVVNSKALELLKITEDCGALEHIGEAEVPAVTVEEAAEAMESRQNLQQLSETMQGRASEMMEMLYAAADLNAEQAGSLRELLAVQNLKQELLKQECFDIPVADESGITGIRLTVIHGSGQEGKFRILLRKTGEHADILDENAVRVDGSYRKGKLELLIAAPERAFADRLRSEARGLQNRLERVGIECDGIFCSTANLGSEAMLPPVMYETQEANVQPETDNVKTSVLYAAAKETVLHIQRIFSERD